MRKNDEQSKVLYIKNALSHWVVNPEVRIDFKN